MKPTYITPTVLHQFIQAALAEDLGDGDHSTLASISRDKRSKAKLLVKEPGVLAGVEVATAIFKEVDPDLVINVFKQDGQKIHKGDIVFTDRKSVV